MALGLVKAVDSRSEPEPDWTLTQEITNSFNAIMEKEHEVLLSETHQLKLEQSQISQENQMLDKRADIRNLEASKRKDTFLKQLNELRVSESGEKQDNSQDSDHVSELKQLRFELDCANGKISSLRSENNELKKMIVKIQTSAEQEEEYISNMLLKKIQDLKKEKADLLIKVEAEEEQITNKLQRQLQQLQQEKIEIENTLEKEQEFMVNRLQKQLDEIRSKSPMPGMSKKWSFSQTSVNSMENGSQPIPASPSVIEMLKAEVNSLKQKLQEIEHANEQLGHSYDKLRKLVVEVAEDGKLELPLGFLDNFPPLTSCELPVPESPSSVKAQRLPLRSPSASPVLRDTGMMNQNGPRRTSRSLSRQS